MIQCPRTDEDTAVVHHQFVVSISVIQIDELRQVVTECSFTSVRSPPAHHRDHAVPPITEFPQEVLLRKRYPEDEPSYIKTQWVKLSLHHPLPRIVRNCPSLIVSQRRMQTRPRTEHILENPWPRPRGLICVPESRSHKGGYELEANQDCAAVSAAHN